MSDEGTPRGDAPAGATPPVADFERDALPFLPDVARFARALTRDPSDADDLVQETFLRAFRSWHTFIPGSDARRWLFTIARNAWTRSQQRERIYVQPDEEDPQAETIAAVRTQRDAGDALNAVFSQLDVGPAIAQAIAELPEVYRLAVQLVDVEGFSYEEAADTMDIPVGTVRSRLFRGRRLLQQALLDHARDAGLVPDRPATPATPAPPADRAAPADGSGDPGRGNAPRARGLDAGMEKP